MFKPLRWLFLWLFSFNSRKHKRFVIPGSVKSKCVYMQSGKRIEFSAVILNISHGGIKLLTGETKVLPKTILEISIELPGKKSTVSMCGEVLRTYRRQNQGSYYSAIKFTEECGDAVKALLDSTYT